MLWGIYHGLLLVGHRLASPWLERIQPTDPVDRACWKALRIVVDVPPGLPRLAPLPRRVDGRRPSACSSAIVNRPAIPVGVVPRARRWSLIIPLWLVQFVQYTANDLNVIARTPWYVRSVFYTACFYAIVLVGQFGGRQFIYFQF